MTARSFVLIAFLIFSSLSVNAQKASADESALKAVIDRMASAQLAYDSAALDSLFTSDFIEISPAGEFDPREKVLSFYSPEANAQSGGADVQIAKEFRSIRTYGNTAVVIVEFAYSMTREGKSLPSRKMMVTVVGRKERGTWKIASAQYTGVRPPKPPTVPN
jgi:uncharacterized protein (TIGR02246 family)